MEASRPRKPVARQHPLGTSVSSASPRQSWNSNCHQSLHRFVIAKRAQRERRPRKPATCPVSITLAGRRQLSWPVEARHVGFSLLPLTLVFCSAQAGRAPPEQSGGGNFPHSSRRSSSDAPNDRRRPRSSPVRRTHCPSPRTADSR